MSVAKPEPKLGDPCPQCGGEFASARVPTAEERKKVEDRDSLTVYPPNTDTATQDHIDEFGVLHTCRDCHYVTRIKPEPEPDTASAAAAKSARAAEAKAARATK